MRRSAATRRESGPETTRTDGMHRPCHVTMSLSTRLPCGHRIAAGYFGSAVIE